MKRLTDPVARTCSMSSWELCGMDKDCKRDCFKPAPCKMPALVLRLTEYEDTGFTPEEIKSLVSLPSCKDCSGVITPKCYMPDGEGCAYQTNVEGGEPIDKCKECPHCYTDKVRRKSFSWLSTKDNPPPKDVYSREYNVVIKGAKESTTLYYAGGKWYDQEHRSYTVTHWQPLPEPPKENE